jgi:hypothetical protein
MSLTRYQFLKVGIVVGNRLYLSVSISQYPYVSYSIGMIFGIRDLHTLLLNTGECRENRPWEDRNFIVRK